MTSDPHEPDTTVESTRPEPPTTPPDARAGEEGSAAQAPTADAPRDESEAKLALLREQLLRTAAELDNVRKRAQRDIEDARRRSLEAVFTELLAVKDSLELGVAACHGQEGPVVEGLGMTLRLVDQLFARHGVVTIDPLGASFDPRYHEAMATQATAEAVPGTVLVVVQKGYDLHGRLLRPARVIVAAAPLDSPGAAPT